MKVERFVVGPLETNCYALIKDSKVILIDPGSGFRRLSQYIVENGLALQGIILTHGHMDHIGAVDSLVKKFNCKCFICQDDEVIIRNKEINFGYSIDSKVEYIDADHLKVGNSDFEVFFTPGHTAGSICLKIENHLFTGDTLFRLGVGRTDLYSGSEAQLRNSLNIFYHFPIDTLVHPGHEQESSIGFEIQNNLNLI